MEKNSIPHLEKCAGAIIGAAVGDALGWPNEQNSKNVSKVMPKNKESFQKWIRSDGGRFWSHFEEIGPGEYSDDTQLIIATARSLYYGANWINHFTKIELPAWLSYERGGGGATKRAAQIWREGNAPWDLEKVDKNNIEAYFNAGGNGVAMRILPHVFQKEDNIDEVFKNVFLNGIFTHGHPRALIGAILYADALLYLLNNNETLGYGELVDYLLSRKDIWGKFPNINSLNLWLNAAETIMNGKYMELWDKIVEEAVSLLKIAKQGLEQGALDIGNEVLEKLGCFDKKQNGSGTITAVTSIYLASKYASNPQQGIVETAYLKNADTDTLASMVGGLLGMLHGSEFLSISWAKVQDYEFLKNLIYKRTISEEKIKAPIFDYNNSNFKNRLKQLNVGESLIVKPFGKIVLKNKKPNKSNIKGIIVNTLKFITEEGQSIFVKTYEKDVDRKEFQKRGKSITYSENKTVGEQIETNEETNTRKFKPLLDARKVRSLVNILPEKLNIDICLQFVADIMTELERNGTGKIDHEAMEFLKSSWEKHGINEENILKVIRIILYY